MAAIAYPNQLYHDDTVQGAEGGETFFWGWGKLSQSQTIHGIAPYSLPRITMVF